MPKRKEKQPKATVLPSERKSARIQADPKKFENETVVWKFKVIDEGGPWGWKTSAGRHWWSKILPELKNFETMTWKEIEQASGGRSQGNNHHFVETEKLTPPAKARLVALELDDYERLYSLRLGNTVRIYGIRDRRAFMFLWYDVHHGNNKKAVYPVTKR